MENKELIEKGISLARGGYFKEAIKIFEEGICFTQDPKAMSYYALCVAEIEGDYNKAISLCLVAAGREFYNPDIYLNIGRIFILKGQKAFAVKSFIKGLKISRTHQGLINAIKKLGVRRKPILPFLPRHNFINRFLGKFVYRLTSKTSKTDFAV